MVLHSKKNLESSSTMQRSFIQSSVEFGPIVLVRRRSPKCEIFLDKDTTIQMDEQQMTSKQKTQVSEKVNIYLHSTITNSS